MKICKKCKEPISYEFFELMTEKKQTKKVDVSSITAMMCLECYESNKVRTQG